MHTDDLETKFNVSSNALKRLTLVFEDVSEHRFAAHQLVIKAPNLEHLYIRDFFRAYYVVDKLHLLTKVVVNFGYQSWIEFPEFPLEYVHPLQKGLTNAKFLSLSKGIIISVSFTLIHSMMLFFFTLNTLIIQFPFLREISDKFHL